MIDSIYMTKGNITGSESRSWLPGGGGWEELITKEQHKGNILGNGVALVS